MGPEGYKCENWEKTGDQASVGVGMRKGARNEEEWKL